MTPIDYGECRSCGATFVTTKGRGKIACSERCSKKLRKHRTGRKKLTKFSVARIGERDGWRCHLCSKKVNPTLPYNDNWAGSVDHLIPRSMGGADVLENVALAHRMCNSRRGAQGLAQLRLIA